MILDLKQKVIKMARTEIDKDIVRKAISNLFRKARDNKGKRFTISNYTIIPKAIVVDDELLIINAPYKINENELKSVIIDVLGLHGKWVTQLEIYEDGTIIYSPGKNRNENDIKEFIKSIASI